LDTGDALLGGGKLGEKTRGEAIVAGMSLMGYDAMALGPKELSLGLDTLRQRMAEAEFPMISANVVLSGTQQLLAEPYVILERAGQKLGVIGLTRHPSSSPAGMQVLDVKQAAERYVPEVAAQADTVIVLTNLDEGTARALAAAVPGIDLVVTAVPPNFPTSATRAPGTNTLVVVADLASPAHSGRAIGRLAVRLQPDGSLTNEQWQTLWMDKRIADDPEMAALLARYQ
jgi:2',3'-cyclic-nucleotide 2'-phosphodiesterase (5'-nucleotidase family)